MKRSTFLHDFCETVFAGTLGAMLIYTGWMYAALRWVLLFPLLLLMGGLLFLTPVFAVITVICVVFANGHYGYGWILLVLKGLGIGWFWGFALMMLYLAVTFLEERAREAVGRKVLRLLEPRQEVLPPAGVEMIEAGAPVSRQRLS